MPNGLEANADVSSTASEYFVRKWLQHDGRSATLQNVNSNAGLNNGSAVTIRLFNKMTRTPTKELQRLVLAMVMDLLREEMELLNSNSEMRSHKEAMEMRLHSLMLNAQELVRLWRMELIKEAYHIIKNIIDSEETEFRTKQTIESAFPAPINAEVLKNLPPDNIEINKTAVADQCIAAQRGQDDADDAGENFDLFLSKYLDTEVAAMQNEATFAKICTAYEPLVQKAVEIDYIERKPETVDAVSDFKSRMEKSESGVVQSSVQGLMTDAKGMANGLVQTLVSRVMNDVMSLYNEKDLKDIEVKEM